MDSVLDLDEESEEAGREPESESDRLWRRLDPGMYARLYGKDW